MYRIFHSESDVHFEKVSFQALELIQNGKNAFFVPQFPNSPEKTQKPSDAASNPTEKKNEDSPLAKTTNIEAIKEEAYTKGKIAGHQDTEKKFHSAIQALSVCLEQISSLKKSLIEKSKEDMIMLIMAVTKKIIRTEIEEKKEIIVNTVNMVLQSAIQADEYYIKVHPEDLHIVAENKPLFLARMKGLQNIYFIADETVSRGGCLAESRVGDVDATIESQLDKIYEHLRTMVVGELNTER
ncbi:MAG: FliH/SctL family protein [Desulfobacterales bacterium]